MSLIVSVPIASLATPAISTTFGFQGFERENNHYFILCGALPYCKERRYYNEFILTPLQTNGLACGPRSAAPAKGGLISFY
jgi:hypothetical protein